MDFNIEALKKIIPMLTNMHPRDDVNDLKAVPLNVAGKILQTVTTLGKIIDEHDYFTSQAVLRILVDSITAFVVVYDCDDHEEMEIRHYLYVLDGISKHKESLENKLSYVEQRTPLPLQVRYNITEKIRQSNVLIDECCKGLDGIKENSQWGDTIDVLKKNKYWKFNSIKDVDKEIKQKQGTKGLQKVTWESLYERVFDKSIVNYLSSELSLYVHGMANAYISYDYSSETESLLKDITSSIMVKFSLSICNIYAEDLHAICSNKNNF